MKTRSPTWLPVTLLGAVVMTVGVLAGARGADTATSRTANHHYLPPGSELHFLVVLAPLPVETMGNIALAASERVARAGAGETTEPTAQTSTDPPILGTPPDWAPPPDWPLRVSGPMARVGRAELAARSSDGKCECKTEIGDIRKERVAVLYASAPFTVGDELANLEMLCLRARYRDGLVAYLNGREVARRNLAPGISAMGLAERPRGPEWETFYIPVVPGLLRRGENVLAVEVRPSGRRLAPALDLELSGGPGGRIVRGPALQRVGATSAVIAFDTDLPTSAKVEYWTGAERGLVAHSAGGGLAVHHAVTLESLPKSEAVHYRVLAGGDASDELVFHTAPQPGDPIRFVVYGDVRGGHSIHHQLVKRVLEEAPDFAIITGDLVLRGSDEGDWQTFFSVAGDLLGRVPLVAAAGNHDLGRAGAEQRRMNEILGLSQLPPPRPEWGHWHSLDVADIHIAVLDSNAYEHEEQLTWLRSDLAAARQRGVRAIFAVTHHSPFSRGPHGGHSYAARHYVPVLAEHDVALLFAGHDHFYQRGRMSGLDYIISGGGGAPLYRARCGVPGRSRCRVEDGMKLVATEYHYVVVTVTRRSVRACPRRLDSTPIEGCVTYSLEPSKATR